MEALLELVPEFILWYENSVYSKQLRRSGVKPGIDNYVEKYKEQVKTLFQYWIKNVSKHK